MGRRLFQMGAVVLAASLLFGCSLIKFGIDVYEEANKPTSAEMRPEVPVGLKAVADADGVKVTWDAVAGATAYHVWKAGLYLDEVAAPLFIDIGAKEGCYRVRSVLDNVESFISDEACVAEVTPEPTPEPGPTPEPTEVRLPAPLGMTAKASPGKVALSWFAVEGATVYQIYRGNVEARLALVQELNYVSDRLPNGEKWCHWVAGVSETGVIGKKAMACATPVFPKPVAIKIVTDGHFVYGKNQCGANHCFSSEQRIGFLLEADYGNQVVPDDPPLTPIIDSNEYNDNQNQARRWCDRQISWVITHSKGQEATITPDPGHPLSNCITKWSDPSGDGLQVGYHHWNAGRGNVAFVALGYKLPSGSLKVCAEGCSLKACDSWQVKQVEGVKHTKPLAKTP